MYQIDKLVKCQDGGSITESASSILIVTMLLLHIYHYYFCVWFPSDLTALHSPCPIVHIYACQFRIKLHASGKVGSGPGNIMP